jgi:hypothetical protein
MKQSTLTIADSLLCKKCYTTPITMSVDSATPQIDNDDSAVAPIDHTERDHIEDLILQNKTLDALIKGLTEDITTFKNDTEAKWTPADIVRFTMQLNIMKDKKARNLAEINKLIKEHKS